MSEKKRAVIYARYSSDSQREESIEGQIRDCEAFAARNGLMVVGRYIDRGKSAYKDTEKRTEFLQMIEDSGKDMFDTVLVWKLDRFSRQMHESVWYRWTLTKNGVALISINEPIGNDSISIVLQAVLDALNEYYSIDLSMKIRRGQSINVEKFKNNGGTTPLGYKISEEGRRVIDEVTAPLVKEIFERYADGERLRVIANSLNERGIRTASGKPFQQSSFSTLISNRTYIGEYHYGGVAFPGAIPAIIDEELFERAQRRRAANEHTPAKGKAKVEYLLSGKAYCGECGVRLVGESGKNRMGIPYYYYKCGNAKRGEGCKKKTLKKQTLEDKVLECVYRFILTDEVIALTVPLVVEFQKKDDPTLPLMEKRLEETTKSIGNIVNAIEKGIPSESLLTRLSELEAQKTELEAAITKERLRKTDITEESVREWLERFKKMDRNDEACRKLIIDLFVQKVVVYDDRFTIFFNAAEGAKEMSIDELLCSDLFVPGVDSKRRGVRKRAGGPPAGGRIHLFRRGKSSFAELCAPFCRRRSKAARKSGKCEGSRAPAPFGDIQIFHIDMKCSFMV